MVTREATAQARPLGLVISFCLCASGSYNPPPPAGGPQASFYLFGGKSKSKGPVTLSKPSQSFSQRLPHLSKSRFLVLG